MSWINCGMDFLKSVSDKELHNAFVSEKNIRAKMRLHAAFLRRQGKKIDDIANTLGATKGAVSKWLTKLNNNGLKAAMPIKQTGRPKRMSAKELRLLRRDLLKEPKKLGYDYGMWSTKLVQDHVKKKFKASFVGRHMRRLLQNMGFTQQKPRPIDYRADSAKQRRFKKNSPGWFLNT